jgi:hypothetical protein
LSFWRVFAVVVAVSVTRTRGGRGKEAEDAQELGSGVGGGRGADTYPDAEIFLMGVEEPKCLIHAPNESVDPSEIEHLAIAEALFLENYAGARR